MVRRVEKGGHQRKREPEREKERGIPMLIQDVRIYLMLNERFHQKEYIKINILKQVTGATEKPYTYGIERLSVGRVKSGPRIDYDPQASKSINNIGIWLVSYAIKRRKGRMRYSITSSECSRR